MKTAGINHIALVARDMAETMRFYTEVLEMPLIKTVELPGGGQHFFFDCGGGSAVAFFWWRDAPPAAPGIASVKRFPGDEKTAVGSMNHLAFHMAEDKLEAAVGRLKDAGVKVVPVVVNHDDSEATVSAAKSDTTFVRSVYFTDPNGIMMEFAANTRDFTAADVRHAPAALVADAA